MPVVDKIFLHFFDTHFIEEKVGLPKDPHLKEMELGILYSLLFSNITYIPVASFIESPICNYIINKYSQLFEYGIIEFVGKGSNFSEYKNNKLLQYPSESILGKKYRDANLDSVIIPFKEKLGSTTIDIIKDWEVILNNFDPLISIFSPNFSSKEIDSISKKWEAVPNMLNNKAFILPHVKYLLGVNNIDQYITVLNKLHRIINSSYFKHFISEYDCGVMTDMVFLEYAPIENLSEKHIPYRYISQIITTKKEYKDLLNPDPEKILINRNSNKLIEIYSESINLKNIEISKINKYNNIKFFGMNEKEITLGIITALPLEFAVMRLMVEDECLTDFPDDPNNYAIGYIKTKSNKKIKVIIAMQKEMGTNNASTTTTNMLRTFKEIENVLLVGIAGGLPNPENPENHVRLGDIVCSNSILQYDNIKEGNDKIDIRSNTQKPSSLLIGKFNILKSDTYLDNFPWEKYIKDISEKKDIFKKPDIKTDILKMNAEIVPHPKDVLRKKEMPRIFLGNIGSANTLLKNENKRNFLRDNYNVRAIEMEGVGVENSTWNCEKSYFIIRGIVDYCNDDKSDLWHGYSALCAASFAKSLIELI